MDRTLFRFLNPVRVVRGVRRRIAEGNGVGAAAVHAVRKTGTVLDRALVGPMVMRINPMGYVCNHACPMCWLQHLPPQELKEQKQVDRADGLKLADYERMFDTMPPGLETVELVGGGEPLVHPEAIEIMAAIRRHGWHGSLISNGTLLKEAAARRLVEMDWNYTRISVHAGDRETYREIQGVDHYDAALNNLKTYTRLRTRTDGTRQGHLCVFHVLQRENIGHVERLFAFAEEVGADSLLFDKIIPYDPDKVLTPQEVQATREAIIACAGRGKIPCNLADITAALQQEEATLAAGKAWVPGKRCSVGFDQTFIKASGEVMPCCFSDEVLGNVKEQPFDVIWAGEKYQKFRERLNHGKWAKYCITNRCVMHGVVHQ